MENGIDDFVTIAKREREREKESEIGQWEIISEDENTNTRGFIKIM